MSSGLPAHDLVCQQDSTHLRVFILALINDRLKGWKKKKKNTMISLSLFLQMRYADTSVRYMWQGHIKSRRNAHLLTGSMASVWQMCVSWESSPPERKRSVLTEKVRGKTFHCVFVCVSACAYVHVCLYAAYSEQLDCQTGV